MQVNLIRDVLSRASKQTKFTTLTEEIKIINRAMPIPPNFSKMPAKIIDP